jgi:hypothetical protein
MLTYYYLPLYTKKILQYPKKTSLAIETCTDFCIISKRVSKKISNLLLSKKGLQVFLCSSSLPYLLLAASVVDPKLFFFIRIPFSSEFWIRIWIRILLGLQKVPDPVPDPALNIQSFTMPTIFKGFFILF